MDILDEIVAHKRVEVAIMKQQLSEHELYAHVETLLDNHVPSMQQALLNDEVGIMAEFKRRSPSRGWIKEEGRADVIPLSYEQNGAAAISILTDEKYFGGRDEFIVTARRTGVTIPIIYKNFVVDEYQLYQARACGASAVLLIAADLSLTECKTLLHKAHALGLEVLLEMHSKEELDYADLEPDMYGINNRNLGTFITDVENSYRMAELLPKDTCKVSESGISKVETIRDLREAGYRGFLIGETFMKTPNPGDALAGFINDFRQIAH